MLIDFKNRLKKLKIKNNQSNININGKTVAFLFLLLPDWIKTFIYDVVLVTICQMWPKMIINNMYQHREGGPGTFLPEV
jgi:hypothetical protein